MSGYLTTTQVESAIAYLAAQHSSFCSLVALPETSVEGRTIHALRIRGGSTARRRGVALLGGVHARELINPDLLVSWAATLCGAYATGGGVTFGPTAYAPATVRLLVDTLDLFVVPLVNPDGHAHVQAPGGERMWRKNRAANPGQPCRGVDLNRNYDFLHGSGIGTSGSSCSDVFRGPNAFSEPETRNVRWLLDTYPHVVGLVDVHSYSELILWPWGDDDNQTTNPAQNFTVPDQNRGKPDSLYKEYIPAADLDWYVRTGTRMKAAIAAVRGRSYTAQQSIGLYPTTATVGDYAYSRSFVDSAMRTVLSVTIETAPPPSNGDALGAFQPPYAEALKVMEENGPALVEFCLAVLCAAEVLLASADESLLAALRGLRDRLVRSERGRVLNARLLDVSPAVLVALAGKPRVRRQVTAALERFAAIAARDADPLLDHDTVGALTAAGAAIARSVPSARELVADLTELLEKGTDKRLGDVVGG